ncbi:hypothetical protein PR202_ga11370 [Eleusine coracana subsp. coracana]|uniref:Myb-like domain-containing protein n=1 Tax=Eleusine coracana subsp. coracana TaxID=191504 RepID=A0AAV5C8V6_ELECO|nr:hypothetical protein PR202_ga11370 [Eleusine coracana subsp. coracana]
MLCSARPPLCFSYAHNTKMMAAMLGSSKKKPRKPYTISRPREKWSTEEHERFLHSMLMFGRDWKTIEQFMETKSISRRATPLPLPPARHLPTPAASLLPPSPSPLAEPQPASLRIWERRLVAMEGGGWASGGCGLEKEQQRRPRASGGARAARSTRLVDASGEQRSGWSEPGQLGDGGKPEQREGGRAPGSTWSTIFGPAVEQRRRSRAPPGLGAVATQRAGSGGDLARSSGAAGAGSSSA